MCECKCEKDPYDDKICEKKLLSSVINFFGLNCRVLFEPCGNWQTKPQTHQREEMGRRKPKNIRRATSN